MKKTVPVNPADVTAIEPAGRGDQRDQPSIDDLSSRQALASDKNLTVIGQLDRMTRERLAGAEQDGAVGLRGRAGHL